MSLFWCCCGLRRRGPEQEALRRPHSEQSPLPEEMALEECQIPVPFAFGTSYPRSPPSSPRDLRRVPSFRPLTVQALEKIAVSWKSPVPITRSQLDRKRAEFWDTASAYGGSVEAWQALRQAVEVGQRDIDTAKMILACAGLSTPTGLITEAYDERGYKYTIPVYCLGDPVNGVAPESPPCHAEESDLPDDVLGRSDSRKLRIRLSIGEDMEIDAPTSEELTVAQIKRRLRKRLQTEQRIELFWAGHGPLAPSIKYSALQTSANAPCTVLQAWLF